MADSLKQARRNQVFFFLRIANTHSVKKNNHTQLSRNLPFSYSYVVGFFFFERKNNAFFFLVGALIHWMKTLNSFICSLHIYYSVRKFKKFKSSTFLLESSMKCYFFLSRQCSMCPLYYVNYNLFRTILCFSFYYHLYNLYICKYF